MLQFKSARRKKRQAFKSHISWPVFRLGGETSSTSFLLQQSGRPAATAALLLLYIVVVVVVVVVVVTSVAQVSVALQNFAISPSFDS
jgi:hypothetical protein